MQSDIGIRKVAAPPTNEANPTPPQPLGLSPRAVLPLIKLERGVWQWQTPYPQIASFGDCRNSTKVACLGANNTGKSFLLNTLFGLEFEVDNGITTTGIDVGLCLSSRADDERSQRHAFVVLDVAGGDALDQDMTVDENNRMALFSFMASDILIINVRYDERTRAAGSFIRALGRVFEGLQNVHLEASGDVVPAKTIVYAVRDYATQEPQEEVERQLRFNLAQEWNRMQSSKKASRTLEQIFRVCFMFLPNAVPSNGLLARPSDPDYERVAREESCDWLADFQWAAMDQFDTILADITTVHAEELVLSTEKGVESGFTRLEALWELSGQATMTSMDHDRLAKQLALQEDSNLFLSDARIQIDRIIRFDPSQPVTWPWELWGAEQCSEFLVILFKINRHRILQRRRYPSVAKWKDILRKHYSNSLADLSRDRTCDEIRALALDAANRERANDRAIEVYWAEERNQRKAAEDAARTTGTRGSEITSSIKLKIQMTSVWCRARAGQQNDTVWLGIAVRQPGQEPTLWVQPCKKMRERKKGLPYTTPFGTVLPVVPELPAEVGLLLVNVARGKAETVKATMLRCLDRLDTHFPAGPTLLRDVLDEAVPFASHIADGLLPGTGQILRIGWEKLARPQLNNRDCVLAFDSIRFEKGCSLKSGSDYGFRRRYVLRHDAINRTTEYEPVFQIYVVE